jgi:peptidoglycan DL-endopeptidase CwlO
MLVYSAFHRKSPFATVARVIGGEQPPVQPTAATFDSLRTGPMITGTGRAATAIAFAMLQIGKDYSHSPDGVNTFDCSLLVQKALAAAGVNIARTTYDQVNQGIAVDPSSLQPGDLIFYQGLDENGQWRDFGHVTMAIGGGMQIEAPRTGEKVQTNPVRVNAIQAVRRYL